MARTIVARIVAETLEHGGCTMHARTGIVPTTGYAVAYEDRGYLVDVADVTDSLIARFIAVNDAMLARPSHYVGTWIDNGRAYIDVSRVFESRDDAMYFGRTQCQISICHIDTGETIYL